eukprot:scpid35843/ scgid8774/ 
MNVQVFTILLLLLLWRWLNDEVWVLLGQVLNSHNLNPDWASSAAPLLWWRLGIRTQRLDFWKQAHSTGLGWVAGIYSHQHHGQVGDGNSSEPLEAFPQSPSKSSRLLTSSNV